MKYNKENVYFNILLNVYEFDQFAYHSFLQILIYSVVVWVLHFNFSVPAPLYHMK